MISEHLDKIIFLHLIEIFPSLTYPCLLGFVFFLFMCNVFFACCFSYLYLARFFFLILASLDWRQRERGHCSFLLIGPIGSTWTQISIYQDHHPPPHRDLRRCKDAMVAKHGWVDGSTACSTSIQVVAAWTSSSYLVAPASSRSRRAGNINLIIIDFFPFPIHIIS